MRAPLGPSLAVARGAAALSRLRGGGGTSAPGRVLTVLSPDAIDRLAGRLALGSALVSATNGKTTTAAMAAGMLRRSGLALVHNRAGANMEGGIASTLLEAAGRKGTIAGQLGLFEVDEAWLPSLTARLAPRVLLLCNLFRDQLDRYGELDTIAQRWAETVSSGAGAGARLVLNADDPTVADLAREGDRERVLFFGIEDPSVALEGIAHAADARHCRRCGAPYRFERVYLGHLGVYACDSCGARRPQPHVYAREVRLHGVRSCDFTLVTPAGSAPVRLPLPGLYNVYNALAAAALGSALGVDLQTIAASLGETEAAFGRAEALSVSGRQLRILLVKNPAGANEVLRTLTLEPGEHDLLCVLNDNIADGRDVSWVWDADFEHLAGRVRRITCAGTRAPEMALRLKYAGIDTSRISVCEPIEDALDAALADRPAGDADVPLYALPTYTAMLSLRDLLVRRGEAKASLT